VLDRLPSHTSLHIQYPSPAALLPPYRNPHSQQLDSHSNELQQMSTLSLQYEYTHMPRHPSYIILPLLSIYQYIFIKIQPINPLAPSGKCPETKKKHSKKSESQIRVEHSRMRLLLFLLLQFHHHLPALSSHLEFLPAPVDPPD
jgi:hypothetical protein